MTIQKEELRKKAEKFALFIADCPSNAISNPPSYIS